MCSSQSFEALKILKGPPPLLGESSFCPHPFPYFIIFFVIFYYSNFRNERCEISRFELKSSKVARSFEIDPKAVFRFFKFIPQKKGESKRLKYIIRPI